MSKYVGGCCAFITSRIYLISWISLVMYIFYNTYIYYMNGRQYYYLRQILGVGLCISRGTAAILNISCALVLLPLCKKLNQVLYRIMSKLCPGVFFFWLEKAKSFHMTVAVTLVIFAVIHSVSHFINLWNFSRNFDDVHTEINMAKYKNESPLLLLMSVPGVTGVSMLFIVIGMAVTSSRFVRRRVYNAFWYTHHLYLPFMVLLMIHPLSGALKEEDIDKEEYYVDSSPKFVVINSSTWLWMFLPLCCFFVDLTWRIFSRNLANVKILNATHMVGRTMSMTISCDEQFACRMGQYVLIQCPNISLMEWHPFTIVKVPTAEHRNFMVWIRVKGDWTEALEKIILERGSRDLSVLIDGPFSSPMEGVSRCEVAICVAAGVGITPFVAVLEDMLRNPRNRLPGRIHLIWIVRHESEITWLAEKAEQTIKQLRNANRPDRLHLEFYVTKSNEDVSKIDSDKGKIPVAHTVVVNERGHLAHILNDDDERKMLLTPDWRRKNDGVKVSEVTCDVVKRYPLVGCRLKKGRPYWDRVFGYWVHLYPGNHLNVYCCGPKKLVKLLRSKCKNMSRVTKTKFTFVHEAFS